MAWMIRTGSAETEYQLPEKCPQCGAVGWMHANSERLYGWGPGMKRLHEYCDCCSYRKLIYPVRETSIYDRPEYKDRYRCF
jgi:hypothetical protein